MQTNVTESIPVHCKLRNDPEFEVRSALMNYGLQRTLWTHVIIVNMATFATLSLILHINVL